MPPARGGIGYLRTERIAGALRARLRLDRSFVDYGRAGT